MTKNWRCQKIWFSKKNTNFPPKYFKANSILTKVVGIFPLFVTFASLSLLACLILAFGAIFSYWLKIFFPNSETKNLLCDVVVEERSFYFEKWSCFVASPFSISIGQFLSSIFLPLSMASSYWLIFFILYSILSSYWLVFKNVGCVGVLATRNYFFSGFCHTSYWRPTQPTFTRAITRDRPKKRQTFTYWPTLEEAVVLPTRVGLRTGRAHTKKKTGWRG